MRAILEERCVMSFYESRAEESRYFHFQYRPIKDTYLHFHSAIELLFAKSAPQEVTIGSETRILEPGEACFCDSFVPHSYRATTDEPAFVIIGDKAYFKDLFDTFHEKRPPTFFHFENFELLAFLEQLCNQSWQNEGGRYESFGGAMKILLSKIAEAVPFEQAKTDKHDALLCALLRHAEEYLTGDLSLRTVAKTFGYSHEHLSRVLHKYLPEQWNAYVNRLRARHAHALMKKHPDRSVLDILYSCGFDSPNTFYRAYKKEFGRKPRA